MRRPVGAAVLVALGAALGCGESDPKAHRLSGEVTYDGLPIPHGDILFSPDAAKKNAGPQGIATIRNGRFDTGDAGKGIAGGPSIVRVTGFRQEGGQDLICEVNLEVDLPAKGGTFNINVPKQPAKGKPAPKGGDI